jgi:hypothetical protein
MASVRHLGLFPWCFDPATSFFSKEDLLKYAVPMWWRVKEWTLDAAADILANSDPPSTETYSDSFVFKITDIPIRFLSTSTFQTEKDLVIAGKAGTGFGTLGPVYNWLFFAYLGDFNLELDLTIGPDFRFGAFAGDTRSASSDGEFDQIGLITSNFCGVSFSTPLKYNGPFSETLYVITSLNATLTATEYWPYDPGDGGGPIYNSATGAQLRGFPS